MRNLILIFVLLAAFVAPVLGQDGAGDQGVRDTISAQIEAFRARDPVTAFTYASPFIQRQFGTAENFGLMVRRGYPMVWDPAEFAFSDQVVRDGEVWQKLQIIDKSGSEHWFAYQLVLVDGRWRINGVFPLKAPGLTA